MAFDLQNLLRALLLSTSDPLDVKTVQQVITRWHKAHEAEAQDETEAAEEVEAAPAEVPSMVTAAQIREGIDALRARLEAEDPVTRIIEGPQGWRLAVSPEYSEWGRLMRNEPRPQRLSPAAMETLAIVAYRQPVTRAEMETIRGVSIDSALNKLLEAELVQVTGRAELPGRPLQYGTSDKFLDYCGIRSIEELPASDVVSARELDRWIREAEQGDAPGDHEVGLPENESPKQAEIFANDS